MPHRDEPIGVVTSESELEVTVPPRLCDAQGVVHASRYLDFVEDAFLGWLADRGVPYDDLRDRGVDLVIGTLTIRYRQPARLGERLRVSSRAADSTARTVTVEFTVCRGPSVLAEAAVTYVAVKGGGSTPLPLELSTAAASG